MTPERPPHFARVRGLLDALDAPVVQLWGWPGTGKRAILQALLADEPAAEYVPAAWLATPLGLEEKLRRKVGRRAGWLVSEDNGDPAAMALAASLLRPGQRLLVAGERRLPLGRGSLATPPEQLLLRPDEIRSLWHGASGHALTPVESEWLRERSDGWYLPLALWARDPATAGGPFEDDARFTFQPIAGFLRERVLSALAQEEEELLRELAWRGRVPRGVFVEDGDRRRRESTLHSLIDRMALPRIEGDHHLLLPRPLAEILSADARRRGGDRGEAAAPGAPEAAIGRGEMVRENALDADAGDAEALAQDALSDGATWPDVLPHSAGRDRRNPVVDVRIGLLGAPRVERRDPTGRLVPVTWSFKRPLRILAYLASAPDLQASREEIASILWPEASDDAIRRNLHPAVSWLRRSVWPGSGPGGVVLLRDGVYSLDPSLRWEVDVRTFLDRVEEGARQVARGRVEEAETSWELAWQLYQGPFVEGWSDRWALAHREELQLRFTDLLRRLGDLKARLGRLTEAEDAYRTLLLEDPLEEGVHVSIMRIYAARGRRDLVNRQYLRLRQVLLQELGVEPSPPTAAVFNELMVAPGPRPYR